MDKAAGMESQNKLEIIDKVFQKVSKIVKFLIDSLTAHSYQHSIA
jgi:hypothetical protein